MITKKHLRGSAVLKNSSVDRAFEGDLLWVAKCGRGNQARA